MKITPINLFSTIHCGQHMARNALLSLTSLHVLMSSPLLNTKNKIWEMRLYR